MHYTKLWKQKLVNNGG